MSAHRYRLSESSGVNVTEPVREEGTDLKRHETQAGQPRRSSSPPSLLALQQQQLLVEAQLQQLQVFQQQQELYDFQRRQQQRLEQQHRLASIHHSAAHAAAASAAKFFAGMGSHTGLHTGAFGGGPGAVVPPPLQPPLQPFAGPASSVRLIVFLFFYACVVPLDVRLHNTGLRVPQSRHWHPTQTCGLGGRDRGCDTKIHDSESVLVA